MKEPQRSPRTQRRNLQHIPAWDNARAIAFTIHSFMLDREGCERRVYRLATLLTGNPIAATQVIAQVVDAQPDLRQLDGAHMDRLTVLRSREINPSFLIHETVPAAVS